MLTYKDWVEKTKHDTVSFEDDEADEMGEDNNRHKQKHKNKSQKTGKFTVLGTQQKRCKQNMSRDVTKSTK